MADENHDADSLHIVVFPWLAFGHMLPFLELSRSLARRGHRISFVSTPRNIERLPKLPHEISNLITFIPLDLPQTEGLRESAEATADLPPEEVPYLKKAFDGLKEPFGHFIKQVHPKPDWIVQDFVQHWMPAIGAELGIPCVFFITFAATSLVFIGCSFSISSAAERVPFPSKLALRRHELLKLKEHTSLPIPSGVSDTERLTMVIQGCRAIAPRSCKELESEYLSLAHDIFKKPIIPVGLLPPSASERNENANGVEDAIMKWLNEQRSGSVIYVALGTEAPIGIEQLHELALGLEAAKLPFIWALRRPVGLGLDVELLPQGFKDRTKGVGMVIMGWVPQVKILAHESVGGFLTHCGWSSIIEGLQSGCPLVLLPLALDQGLNARLMEEKGFGFEIERNEEDGSFSRADVAKAVRLIMVDDEEGETYRKKAKETKEIIANKEWQEKYVDDFIQYLAGHQNTN